MDALRNRVRFFTEGIMIMACPVLLAMALNKVNWPRTKGHELARGIIAPITASALEAGVLPFVFLSLSKCVVVHLYGASKRLVHLCALLLMVLAFVILQLTTMGHPLYMLIAIPFAVATLRRCRLSAQKKPQTDTEIYGRHKEMLENLVDFSAAVTGVLFLGLEGLALEGQSTSSSNTHGLDRRLLAASLGLGFFTCVLGVFVMLLGTVPPLTNDGKSGAAIVERMNIVLAICTGATVILIACAAVKEEALLAMIPALVTAGVWGFSNISDGASDREEEVCKAGLSLTKVTFTGFFAVSVLTTIGNSSLRDYAKAFIIPTAAAVISGIGWRLLTHRKSSSRAVVVAANAAAFFAHMSVAIAVVPFAIMAVKLSSKKG